MALDDVTVGDVARVVGYLLVGAVGTLVGAIVALRLLGPLRPAIYEAYYLSIGPWSATEAASVLVFAAAVLTPGAVLAVVAAGLEGDRETAGRVAVRLVVGLGLVLTAVAGALFLHVEAVLMALVAVAAVGMAVPVGLWWAGSWAGGGPTFLGSVPVMLFLLLVLGAGLGWGGGYDLVAREVPADAVDEPVATFEGYEAVRDDLLSPDDGGGTYANCETADGLETCRLPLRGYVHEAAAARFLAANGVRCGYRGSGGTGQASNRSFVAEADGSYYRLRCQGYGD